MQPSSIVSHLGMNSSVEYLNVNRILKIPYMSSSLYTTPLSPPPGGSTKEGGHSLSINPRSTDEHQLILTAEGNSLK